MKAMILAAGRGERMRPLTDHTPKPLLSAAGKPLIVHTIEQLVAAGYHEIIINHAHLGQQIEQSLGNGNQFGAEIRYSPEGNQALETAGGIINALPLLNNEVFLVVNGDIATNLPFSELKTQPVDLAHLVLVNNPVHNPNGDFGLESTGSISDTLTKKFTFSGIGLYHPELFRRFPSGIRKLLPVLMQGIAEQRVSGQLYSGFWMDIGTPQRLQELDSYYQQRR